MLSFIVIILNIIFIEISFSKVLTLDILQVMSKKNDFKLKAQKQELESKKDIIKKTKSSFYPRLGIKAQQGQIETPYGVNREKINSIYGQINLFNGLKDTNSLHKSEVEKDIAWNNLKQLKISRNLLIEKLFYQYLFFEKRCETINNEIKRTRFHLKLIKKRLLSRLVSETDLLEFNLYLKELRAQQSYLKLEKKQILEELLFRANLIDKKESYQIKGNLPHLKINEQFADIKKELNKTFLLKREKLMISRGQYDQKIADSGWYPQLDLQLEHGQLDEIQTGIDSDRISSRAFISATWEFFSGFKTKNQKNIANSNLLKRQYLYKQKQQSLYLKLIKNYQNLKRLEDRIDLKEEGQKMAKTLYDKTLMEYKKGVKDSGALANASKKINLEDNEVFELKTRYLLIKIELEELLGRNLRFHMIQHKRN
jgi:outer membrane protein TolC